VRTTGGNREIIDGTLRIRLLAEGPRQTLAVAGELDLANAATLEAELQRAADGGAEAITLDLRELEFIDSTGIAVLVAAHRRLNDGASRVRLVHSDAPAVRRVIRITGLERELPFMAGGEEPASGRLPPL
jgi:anti-sigma B factor antagonist